MSDGLEDIQDLTLRRPIIRWVDETRIPACPRCQADISETLGTPVIPTMRLSGQGPNRIDGRTVNVRGFRCEKCEYILAIAPENANVDVADPDERDPAEPWVVMGAVFADGSKRPVVVPRREVGA